jgi:hypothetical protein
LWEKRQNVHKEEIEQNFVNAGWDLDGSFDDHLVIGHSGEGFSILAHVETWGTEDPVFELLDHERMITYWVSGEIPSPQQAQALLEEHGELPEKWEQPS